MGTDLYPIANHQLSFANKTLAEIVAEIQPVLDKLVLSNYAFLLDFALKRNADNPTRCRQIQQTVGWSHLEEDIEYYDFNSAEYKSLDFAGPCNLQITFYPHQLLMMDPLYRYRQWLGLQKADGTPATEHRNEWRKYLRQMANAFGGNRVIYLADNTHPLDNYCGGNETFEEVEQALKERFGEPKPTFSETLADEQHSYFIDRFTDIT